MLGTVKGHVTPDGEAFRTVSTMVNKTVQAMSQFKVVRKHMVSLSFQVDCFFVQTMTDMSFIAQLNSVSTQLYLASHSTDKSPDTGETAITLLLQRTSPIARETPST